MGDVERSRLPLRNVETADLLPMVLPTWAWDRLLARMIARSASCGDR
jgi:hypothetical protein